MIKNSQALRRLERKLAHEQKADFAKNLRLIDALYEEAALLGAFPLKDPLAGLEVDIAIAEVVNSVSKSA